MSRALSLSSCESFSPALLRSEPAALAAWIRFKLAKWLISAPLKKSGWVYGESGSPAAHGSVHVGGGDGGKIHLHREDQKIELVYHFPGNGFELGMAIPHTMMQQLPCPKGSTQLWLNEGEDVTGDGHQEKLDPLGITRCCVLLDFTRMLDANVNQRASGTAGCAVLFGVRPGLAADLSRLAMYSRRLSNIVASPISRSVTYVPGLRSEWTPMNRAIDGGGIDTRAIKEDVELIFSQYGFRSVIFFANVQGTAHSRSVAYVGRISNPVEDDRGALPDPQQVKNLLKFGLEQVGKSKKEIEQNLAGKAEEFLDGKIKNENLKKVVDFGLEHVGSNKKEMGKDLINQVAGSYKDKIDGMVSNPIAKKIVDFGIDHAGENLNELKTSAVEAVLVANKDLIRNANFPSVAVAAIAIAGNKQVRSLAGQAIQLPDIARTIFDEAGNRLGLPTNATSFLKDNAAAVMRGDWETIAIGAVSNKLGGGTLGNQAAAIALEKITGQPVTSASLQQLGAQGLIRLLDKSPVVASGKAGEAAVTAASASGVTVATAAGSQQVSHEEFGGAYDTVASPGLE